MDLSYQDSSDEDSNIFINNSLKPINNWNFLFQMKTELNLPAYFWGKLVTVKNLTAICRAKTYKGKNLPDLKWPVLRRPTRRGPGRPALMASRLETTRSLECQPLPPTPQCPIWIMWKIWYPVWTPSHLLGQCPTFLFCFFWRHPLFNLRLHLQ